VLEQVTVFKVIHTNIAVLKDSWEEIVYFSCNIKYVTDTANTQLQCEKKHLSNDQRRHSMTDSKTLMIRSGIKNTVLVLVWKLAVIIVALRLEVWSRSCCLSHCA